MSKEGSLKIRPIMGMELSVPVAHASGINNTFEKIENKILF
jgi:hypothetical protein